MTDRRESEFSLGTMEYVKLKIFLLVNILVVVSLCID